MPPRYVAIDFESLRRMYVEEQMSMQAIAQRLRCGSSTVRRRLRALGIPVRSRGPNMERLRKQGHTPTPAWSPEMAWVVGLIATDGNLARAPRRISITSKDIDLLESVRRCLSLSNRFGKTRGLGVANRLQWRNRALYDWLLSLGLTPRKSLTIGPLTVPDEYFADFLRGCIDGDGTVLVYTDRYHAAKKASYVYQRLYVSIVSASRPFIEWIETTIYRLSGLRGGVHLKAPRKGLRPVWVLRYSKKASIRLLRWMYYAPDVVCLARKRAKADPFIWGEKEGILGRRAGVSELEYDADSKSAARKGVGVRVPSPAPPSLTMPPAGR
jgi:hypothetical protein